MVQDAAAALADAGAQTALEGATDPKRVKEEGVGLIFEQILIAFILAFVFRAFVLEAFVIPTGSMATTLLGAHLDYTCPDCGWNFKVNYPTDSGTNAVPGYARVGLGRGVVVDRVYNVRCPNCAYRFPRDDPHGRPDNDAVAPPVNYGDRILVLKHLYLFTDPQRWDVVVFKTPWVSGNPANAALPPWSTEPFQQNYIKRLVGLPGDTLMLLGGDVYVTREQKTLAELKPGDFHIARKSDVAQSALWRVVYDDDHRPQGLPRDYRNSSGALAIHDPAWVMPWQADGWTRSDSPAGGGFDLAGGNGTLRFDPTADPATFPLTDYLAYDVTFSDQRVSDRESPAATADTFDRDFGPTFVGRQIAPFNVVSDLSLRFQYQRDGGASDGGPLKLRLSKRGDTFEATLTPDRAALTRTGRDGRTTTLFDVETGQDFADPQGVEFSNADYRVRLKIAGETVFETTDEQYAPDVAELKEAEVDDEGEPLPTVEIAASGHAARVRHLSLWRDTYHTARDQLGNFMAHASPWKFPDNVVRLGEGEYFTLGDNPFLSGDARVWTDRVSLPYEGGLTVEDGRVPGRFMLGRAFFVYWPASHRPGGGLPALVPNFGDMRFIR